jgi:hypothetical protein
MKQHPIPQDITNYKFHLIGQMTLKQFAEIAVAVVLAFIIFKTNLLDIIKWPLIFLTVGGGALIAFVPIEERPMDHWIKTFFKNIYRPTKFFWKKANKIPELFNYRVSSTQEDFFAPNVNLNPARKQRIFEYLKSIPGEEQVDEFDLEENQKIGEILNTFDQVQIDQKDLNIEPQKQERPNLKTRVRSLSAPQAFIASAEHQANQVFGLVVDENGEAVPQAIVEIVDQNGQSQRLMKSDLTGNFSSNKPLNDGVYTIIVEKNEQKYPELKIELKGEVINPLVIKP